MIAFQLLGPLRIALEVASLEDVPVDLVELRRVREEPRGDQIGMAIGKHKRNALVRESSKGRYQDAAAGIQRRRSEMDVTCGPGGRVHDYVPLYFGALSPMLLRVINAKNVDQSDVLYFEFPIDLADDDNTVFTDASANTEVPPEFFDDPADLDRLNWDAIDSRRWADPSPELRHQRMAELLVHMQLPLAAASHCVVWNADVRQEVREIVRAVGGEFPPITFESRDRRHWFKALVKGQWTQRSLVSGPNEIARRVAAAEAYVTEHRGRHADTARFTKLGDLRDVLREDFACLAETAELVGLRTREGGGRQTIDQHSQEVARFVRELEEFETLTRRQRLFLETAAYLHDVGKGPRSRWTGSGGVQTLDLNHAILAARMLRRILTEELKTISASGAATLIRVICYHDLVSDVLHNDRDESQIIHVARSVGDLEMLFALSRADSEVLGEVRWDEDDASALFDRCRAAIEK